MASDQKLQVAIVGAGIAGLTAAIALKHHPRIEVHIYEQATELREIGASIALGPNGMRTLDRLGIHNALDDEIAFRNRKTGFPHIYRHYKTNEIVSVDGYKGQVEDRHQTSRFYRAHLQQALLEHIDPTQLHLGKTFVSSEINQSSKKLTIKFLDGTSATAEILLGTDGINSPVRRSYKPDSAAKWTGWVTFRSVFPISHVAHIRDLPDEANHFWGHDRTVFLSKLGKDLFTFVGSYQSDPNAEDAPWKQSTWNADGDVELLREYYKDWSPLIRQIVDAVPYTRIYPNASGQGLDSWILGNGRVTLAGDAAHAHGGAFAAGGSLAIDDAWAFASSLLQAFPTDATKLPSDEDISRALRVYNNTRKPHTDRVLETVHKGNNARVAAIGKSETDEQLRARFQNRINPTWIHEHDVQEAFRKAVEKEKHTLGVQPRL
ncbi:FAD/NAD(P)-binding domain-containing protein [Aaosphaeria arxii CBS 175.79]|uniref:FAD/NAD(P)-binding domain-containing protein n=1 Tax=Aaosphaeria arxii CBS 175.79 TaxID=1450172 RepID=A0A6A5XN08_9PLEO|nr:FAD/NAD(P)-binding domain-containing protein [Aaosphaeria arxii CBS 175.79]KAF2014502.1 FAD/NAD(P)-binding domain-containing protein [Aaosphaeria arxii CBS 175.79]